MTVFEEELNTDYVQVSDYDGDGVDDLFIAVKTGHGYRNARVFFTVATVITVAANAERRFRRPGKLAAGRADVCPPIWH